MVKIQDKIIEQFKNGKYLIRLNHRPSKGDEIELKLNKEWLPYLHSEVHLLSPHIQHERNLLYSYIQELIQLFPELVEEEMMDKKLLSTLKTLLLALDYISHERFINGEFQKEHREKLYNMLEECTKEEKGYPFSNYANRPILNKAKIIKREDKVYCVDRREEKNVIYKGVLFIKPVNKQEKFKQIGHFLGEINLKPNTDKVSYEDAMNGKPDNELHVDVLFYINMIKRTFSWLLNSASWRMNKLMPFDEMEIYCKLGLK